MAKRRHRTLGLEEAAHKYLAEKSERDAARLLRPKVLPAFRWNCHKAPSSSNGWQKWELALLGKCSDRDAARQTGRTLKAIISRRRKLRIQMFNSGVQRWQKWEKDLLGKISDQELADRTGRKATAVQNMRDFLGIERFGGAQRRWTKREMRLLGKYPDFVVASRIDRTVEAVKGTRLRFHIAPCLGPVSGFPASVEEMKHYPPPPWSRRDEVRLGTLPDRELARQIGRSAKAVTRRRTRLGIPAFQRTRAWTSAEDGLLGTRPDSELAKQFGRPISTVKRRRQRLGVPAFRRLRPWTPAARMER